MDCEKEISACDRVVFICGWVAEGFTIRQIAELMDISAGRVIQIVSADEESSKQYARARDAASDIFESDILKAAESVTPESAPADRIKIDALKWVAARRSPRKYSEKISQDITTNGKDLTPTFSGMYGKPDPDA